MEKDYRMAVFSRSPIFGQFPIGTLDELAGACEAVEYEAGALIFAEGDMPKAMMIIDEGTVELVKRVGDSKGLVLTHLGPGDIVEVNSFMDGRPHSLSAVARSATRLIKIPLKVLLDVVGTDPHTEHRVLLEILRIQSAGIRTLNTGFNEFLSRAAG